jgi:hypothetical protein
MMFTDFLRKKRTHPRQMYPRQMRPSILTAALAASSGDWKNSVCDSEATGGMGAATTGSTKDPVEEDTSRGHRTHGHEQLGRKDLEVRQARQQGAEEGGGKQVDAGNRRRATKTRSDENDDGDQEASCGRQLEHRMTNHAHMDWLGRKSRELLKAAAGRMGLRGGGWWRRRAGRELEDGVESRRARGRGGKSQRRTRTQRAGWSAAMWEMRMEERWQTLSRKGGQVPLSTLMHMHRAHAPCTCTHCRAPMHMLHACAPMHPCTCTYAHAPTLMHHIHAHMPMHPGTYTYAPMHTGICAWAHTLMPMSMRMLMPMLMPIWASAMPPITLPPS